MFYLDLLNALVIAAAVFEGSFPNVNLMYQENYDDDSLLMNIMGKPKNAGKRETVLTGG